MPIGRSANRSLRTGNTGPTVIGRRADEGADFTAPGGAISATDPRMPQGGQDAPAPGANQDMTLEGAYGLLNTTGVDPTSPELLGANAMIVADKQGTGGPAVRDTPPGVPGFAPGFDQGVAAGGYSPHQWADDPTAQQLAEWLGGEVVNTPGPASGPYGWPGQGGVQIGGQLFNAGMLASRFKNVPPSMALKRMSDELANRGVEWSAPTSSPAWGAALTQHGGDAESLSGHLAQDPSRLSSQYQASNRFSSPQNQPSPGGGAGPGGGGGEDPNFPVSGGNRDIDFPTTGGYTPNQIPRSPYNFDPYAGVSGGFDPYGQDAPARRPNNSGLRSGSLGGG